METFLSNHHPRHHPPPSELRPDFLGVPKCNSSFLGRPLLLVAATSLSPPTGVFIPGHLPRPIAVLLCPDHGLTSLVFLKCNSSSPDRLLLVAAASRPSLWPTRAFISNHLPRPITVLLLPNRDLNSLMFLEVNLFLSQPLPSSGCRHRWPCCGRPEPSSLITIRDPLPSSSTWIAASLPQHFPKCNSSSSGRPLLLAAAAITVADRGLPLRPPSQTHQRPPLPESWPDFPGVSRSATLPLLAALFF